MVQRLEKIRETLFALKGKPWSSVIREIQMKKQIIQGENNGRMA